MMIDGLAGMASLQPQDIKWEKKPEEEAGVRAVEEPGEGRETGLEAGRENVAAKQRESGAKEDPAVFTYDEKGRAAQEDDRTSEGDLIDLLA